MKAFRIGAWLLLSTISLILRIVGAALIAAAWTMLALCSPWLAAVLGAPHSRRSRRALAK